MLLKGIITGKQQNKFLVRVPSFETAGNSDQFIMRATLCYTPGNLEAFKINDIVYVGFENNDIGYPVILGKLYTGPDKDLQNEIVAANLEITNKANLPINTSIGDISYNDLLNVVVANGFTPYLNYQHNIVLQLSSIEDADAGGYLYLTINNSDSEKFTVDKLFDKLKSNVNARFAIQGKISPTYSADDFVDIVSIEYSNQDNIINLTYPDDPTAIGIFTLSKDNTTRADFFVRDM